MFARKHSSIIVATDVFGITPELYDLVQALTENAVIVSPHLGTRTYRNEAEGYASFMEQGGVEGYARHISGAIAARAVTFDLALGFSAGATALWLCLADWRLEPHLPRRATLYYGSRIREHAHLKLRRPARLVFAEREASFDPGPLAETLRQSGFEADVIPGSTHGFMNPLSPGYDARLYAKEMRKIWKSLR